MSCPLFASAYPPGWALNGSPASADAKPALLATFGLVAIGASDDTIGCKIVSCRPAAASLPDYAQFGPATR